MATPTHKAPAPPPVLVPGIALRTEGVYVFRCPVCAHTFRYDDPYEPMCTGPSWRDEHPPTVMRHWRTEARQSVIGA